MKHLLRGRGWIAKRVGVHVAVDATLAFLVLFLFAATFISFEAWLSALPAQSIAMDISSHFMHERVPHPADPSPRFDTSVPRAQLLQNAIASVYGGGFLYFYSGPLSSRLQAAAPNQQDRGVAIQAIGRRVALGFGPAFARWRAASTRYYRVEGYYAQPAPAEMITP